MARKLLDGTPEEDFLVLPPGGPFQLEHSCG